MSFPGLGNGNAERRSLERDLHDGAQQRLIERHEHSTLAPGQVTVDQGRAVRLPSAALAGLGTVTRPRKARRKFLPRGETFPARGRDSWDMDSRPGDETLLLAVLCQLSTQVTALRQVI